MATRRHNAGWFFRLGRAARRVLRGYGRGEQQTVGWLVSNGLPAELTWGAAWIVRLAIVAILLNAAFWVALLLLFGIAAAWVARNTDWDDDESPEWREGHSGFGLYDRKEWRHDIGVYDDK